MIIDKPYVVDRETVKSLLQISVVDYDTLIDLYLPIVSEDVELICNQCFVKEYTGTLTTGSAIITDVVLGQVYKNWLVSTEDYTQAKITDADMDQYTLTTDATAGQDLTLATVLINQFPIAKRIVVAQMIAYQVSKNIGINSASTGSVQSKSLPPLSVTYNADDNALHSGYGYPKYIVNSLEQIKKPRFV